MPRTIIIIKNGKMKLEGDSFVGEACTFERDKILAFLKNAAGIEISEFQENLKPEFYQKQELRMTEKQDNQNI